MAKAPPFCSLDDGSTPTASRPRQAAVEIAGTAYNAAKDMGKDKLETIRENFPALRFLWDIARSLKDLGLNQGERIDNLVEERGAYREAMLRYAENIIHPFSMLYARNPQAAEKMNNIGSFASEAEVNPFMSQSRYGNEKVTIQETNEELTQNQIWHILQNDIKDLAKMDPEAPKILKSVFDSYAYFRRQLKDAIIHSYKVREGEEKLKNDEVSPNVRELIQSTNSKFESADNDAYIKFLRSGNYVVNTYAKLPIELEDGTAKDLVESRFFENRSEAERYAAQMREQRGEDYVVEFFKRSDIDKILYGSANRSAINSFFDKMRVELDKNLRPKEGDPDYAEKMETYQKTMDSVHEAALLLYPETSVRKDLVAKRKGTPGFIQDMLQVYAIMADRYTNQIANIRYGAALDREVKSLRDDIKKIGQTDPDKGIKADALGTEVTKRVLKVGEPPSRLDKYASAVSQFGFTWFLGFNPASALVNAFQVPGVTLPYLAARFENGQLYAWKTLGDLYGLNSLGKKQGTLANQMFGKTFGTENFIKDGSFSERLDDMRNMTEQELNAKFGLTRQQYELLDFLDKRRALRSGMQMYDINDISHIGGEFAGSIRSYIYKFQKWSGFAFQKMELINREMTALAAYRMARERAMIGKTKPMTHEEAMNFAYKAVRETQGAYGQEQAPRPFMNPVLRTVLMFKKFPAHMATMYVRMFKDMYSGATPEERRIARRQFTGMMGMSAFFSGVAGMPFYYIIRDVMNMVFGDEDEPYSFDLELRNFLVEQLGDDVGHMMYRGVLGQTGADIGSRLAYESSFLLGGADLTQAGLPLPFLGGVLGLRDIRRGETMTEALSNTAWEALGAGAGIVKTASDGFDEFRDGEIMRGVEKMTPAFLRNIMKSYRYGQEGVLSSRGDPIIEDISTRELVMQALGFTPQRLSTQYKLNNQIKDIEQEILQRRSTLMDLYAKAKLKGDDDRADEIRDEIDLFNDANPERGVQITSDSLQRSLRKRKERARETEAGISIAKGLRGRLGEYQDLAEKE